MLVCVRARCEVRWCGCECHHVVEARTGSQETFLSIEHSLCTSGFTLIKSKGKTPHVIRPENDKSKKGKPSFRTHHSVRFKCNWFLRKRSKRSRNVNFCILRYRDWKNSNKSASNYSTIWTSCGLILMKDDVHPLMVDVHTSASGKDVQICVLCRRPHAVSRTVWQGVKDSRSYSVTQKK